MNGLVLYRYHHRYHHRLSPPLLLLLFFFLVLAAPVEILALKGSQHLVNSAEHLREKVEKRIDTQGINPNAIHQFPMVCTCNRPWAESARRGVKQVVGRATIRL